MPRNLTEQTITQAVQRSFDGSEDERFRQLFVAFVAHLHDFAREVRLDRDELFVAADFIKRLGQSSDASRQEVLLLSDLLGLSTLVELMGQAAPAVTESSVLGPFFREERPKASNGADISGGLTGVPLFVSGRVHDQQGHPLSGAQVDAWQSDGHGHYDVQQTEKLHGATANRALLTTDDNGEFCYWCVAPVAYPVASDGPCGEIMRAARRSLMRPQHIHFRIRNRGYQTLITQVARRDDRYLDSDSIFAASDSLVADFVNHDAGEAPDGSVPDVPYVTMDWTFILEAATS